MKNIMLLGASGSIGMQTVNVVNHYHQDFSIIGVSVGYNIEKLKEILAILPEIRFVGVADEANLASLQATYPNLTFFGGEHALKQLAQLESYDILVNAVVGFRGLVPTLTAIEHGKDVALANKESLVAGGPLVKEALSRKQVKMYPLDSEHSAIFQCLRGNQICEVDKLIVTASGGSFRDRTRSELANVTVEEALCHPNWNMGGRITIDSATMMNKGFEVIEAHYLFDIPFSNIDVVIHRESIIHSFVQFQDFTIMAQLGPADMRLPIQYALTYPNRLPMHEVTPLDFTQLSSLNFQKVDFVRYPLLSLAYQVGEKGGNLGAIMNGADEAAVALFLKGEISFLDIEDYVLRSVEHIAYIEKPTLEDLIQSDAQARAYVQALWKGVM